MKAEGDGIVITLMLRWGEYRRRVLQSHPLRTTFCKALGLIASQSCHRLRVPSLGSKTLASITIRNLDDEVKTRLRVLAADNGRSMEEEARLILRGAVGRKPPTRNLAAAIRARIAPLGGVDLELPPREPAREPPSSD